MIAEKECVMWGYLKETRSPMHEPVRLILWKLRQRGKEGSVPRRAVRPDQEKERERKSEEAGSWSGEGKVGGTAECAVQQAWHGGRMNDLYRFHRFQPRDCDGYVISSQRLFAKVGAEAPTFVKS